MNREPPYPRAPSARRAPSALRRAVVWLWLSASISAVAGGVAQGLRARAALAEDAADWDAHYDPLVLEGGVLRALGPRLPDAADGSVRYDLQDSAELTGPQPPERLLFRREEVIQVRTLDRRIYRYADLAEAFGLGDLRIDSTNLQLYLERWGATVVALIAGTWALFFGGLYLALGLVLSAMAAGLNRAFTRAAPGGTSADDWLKHALRAACILPPAWAALGLADIHTGCVTDLAIYTPMLALGAWLLQRDERSA